jgi:hypothetical protein
VNLKVFSSGMVKNDEILGFFDKFIPNPVANFDGF